MANTITQGSDLMLFIGGKSVAAATNHTLSISAETADTSHKDIVGTWKTSTVKTLSWEITTENLFTLDGTGKAYDDLFTAMVGKTELTVVFGSKTSASAVPQDGWVPAVAGPTGTIDYTGKAIITSLQLNAPNGDNATYTATLTGVGELTKVTA